MLHSAQKYPTESVLTVLINDVSNLPDDFAVVLDDYHLISSEAVHTGMVFLLDHLPPHMHLVLATRVDPPLPLARLRGRGFMQEVGADDLRFTLDEAAQLVNPMLQTPLSTEDVGSLNAPTEGWAVGLKMAALSMRGQKDVRNLLVSFTGSQRYVMDYLVEEVLKQQSTGVREFLLMTSILEKLTAPLCDSVTGLTVSQDMLTRLESLLEGFLVPLDESRRWYRYHHLFGDLLRHQLDVVAGAVRVKQRHRLASEWYEGNGWRDDAIHHALEAQDCERAVRLIHDASAQLVKRGEISTLLNWLWRIPDESLRTDLQLYRQYAYPLQLAGHLERAEAALNYLETADEADPALKGEVAVSQADLARQRGDNARAVELAESALAVLPPDALAMRARANYILGLIPYDEGAFDRSLSFVTGASEIGRQAKDYVVAARGLAYAACCVRLMSGDLSLADDLARQAIELAGQTPASSVALYAPGEVLYERNDLEGAARNFQMACEMNELFGNPHPKVSNYYHLALTRMASGDMNAAVEVMENSDRAARHSAIRPAMRAYHSWARVAFSIRMGDIAAATSWGSRVPGQGEGVSSLR
jgi:LuxR family maltose regulon positive regulatory protein